MARAGMLHRGSKNGADGGDDVQRSLELLDQVLSEFDDGDPRSLETHAALPAAHTLPAPPAPNTPHTPDDDSPSLTGHQSEDDGYMSMNGRRAKFALGFRPTEEREESETADTPLSPPRTVLPTAAPSSPLRTAPLPPPPPEEAERIISTLLPKVSPSSSTKRSPQNIEELISQETEKFDSIVSINGVTSATQTTLPKTRHQRPYGWEKGSETPGFQLQPPPPPPCRFASLPYGNRPPPTDTCLPPAWLPARHSLDKRSPSFDNPPLFPFMGLSTENDKPYNEHPVTIYPGPTKQYKTHQSPATYAVQRVPPFNQKSQNTPDKKIIKPDERIEAALSPKKIPPRTLAGSMERHREVCRGSTENMRVKPKRSSKNNDEDHFSDDSLEESLPPPPPTAITTPSKRNSIAWEVSLDSDDPLLTPGSTKVIGRRRRKSGDNSHSSTSSLLQQEECEWGTEEEYWPPPPPATSATEDDIASPFSDTESDRVQVPLDINSTGTYVIRKGKNRKQLPNFVKTASKPAKSNISRHCLNRSYDADKSIDGSSVSLSGISSSHNSVSSYSSRPSSEVSTPQSRFSADLNSRQNRELNTPNSRYSIDLGTPNSRISKEITSPKSRLSLDLNNGPDRHVAREYLNCSPKNYKTNDIPPYVSRQVPNKLSPQNRFTDFKKYSSTFDNIKSLMKEGKVEQCDPVEYEENIREISVAAMPNVVRVVSLPSLANDKDSSGANGGVNIGGGSNGASRQALITTVEEEEDQDSIEPNSSDDASPLRKIENNITAILSQGRDQKHFPYAPKDWNIHKDEYCDDISNAALERNVRYGSRERQKRHDLQKSSSNNEIGNGRSAERREGWGSRRRGGGSSRELPSSSDSAVSSGGDFPVTVQILEHSYRSHPLPPSPPSELGPLPQTPESPSFPPLPPSPVQEVDDEYSEILQPRSKPHAADPASIQANLHHRSSDPPAVPPHRESSNSLKTRSMETAYSKNKRSSNFKNGSTDRRTLPNDMAASGVRRRTLQRQTREATPPGSRAAPLQTSASLPETPIFARGCDVPRTPLRHTPPGGPRQSNTMNSIQTIGGSSTLGGYGRGGAGSGVERALAGAELLRLAGGPARGWYPRQRHRPASTEHLDRLSSTCKSVPVDHAAWDGTGSRKPLTLPPNLTPKFFQRSPREALRRVTSLLIRKGNAGKEKENTRRKEATSPAARSVHGDDHPGQKQRKGFFKSLWKRSRHYSLEHP